MRIHLIHGFNVGDGGRDTILRLKPYLEALGHTVIVHDYGWVGLLRLRWRNDKAVDDILPHIRPGDVLAGHSNGCLICWKLVEAGAPVSAVICIQPALRRDTVWPARIPVLCTYNDEDKIVSWGRIWGRFVSTVNPFRDRHGWGAAGRHGFDTLYNEKSRNEDTKVPPVPASGHSGIFKRLRAFYWTTRFSRWLELL